MSRAQESNFKPASGAADPPRSVSRFGDVQERAEDPVLADMFARIRATRGRLLNIHRVVGLAPNMLRAQASYARALREESSLPRALQELLIMRIAQVNDSAYEQSVHRPIALNCGVSAEKLDALPSWNTSPAFEPRERAALHFVDQAAASGEVDDEAFLTLRQSFSPREIVELTALIGWYVGNSRFVRALQVAAEGAPD